MINLFSVLANFRLDYDLSSEDDGMIGIYDLPSSWFLPVGEVCGMPTKIKLAQEAYPVFTSVRLDLDFPTIGVSNLLNYNSGMFSECLIIHSVSPFIPGSVTQAF